MGHDARVFEQRKKLDGMLRYGIPNYHFPREILDEEINFILSTGIKFELNVSVGKDIEFSKLKKNYDAIYIMLKVLYQPQKCFVVLVMITLQDMKEKK